VNLPKPQALLARLFVMLHACVPAAPPSSEHLAVSILELLREARPSPTHLATALYLRAFPSSLSTYPRPNTTECFS